jgi:trimeric autotransporter adhesin
MAFGLIGLILLVLAVLVGIAVIVGVVLLIVKASKPKTPPAQPYHRRLWRGLEERHRVEQDERQRDDAVALCEREILEGDVVCAQSTKTEHLDVAATHAGRRKGIGLRAPCLGCQEHAQAGISLLVGVGAGAGAAGAVVVAGSAALRGTGVMAAAGAFLAAAAGVVTVLSTAGDAPQVPEPAVVSAPGAMSGAGGDDASGTGGASPSDLSGVDADGVVAATLDASLARSTLEPRVAQELAITVVNSGPSSVRGAFVDVVLPDGMELAGAATSSGGGQGATVSSAVSGTPGCAPDADDVQRVRCALGTLEPDDSRSRTIEVVARDGGLYALGAELWADGVEPRVVALDPMTVRPFGAELAAESGDASELTIANPGDAWVPLGVRNTGDLAATAAWALRVGLPRGMRLVDTDGELECAAEEKDGAWTCSPKPGQSPLAPGSTREGRIRIVADGTASRGAADVTVTPEVAEKAHAVAAVVPVTVGEKWGFVSAGMGPLRATCSMHDGLNAVQATVVGDFVNTSPQELRLRLDAGENSAKARLGADESTTIVVGSDRPLLNAGAATWTVSTDVAGETYRTTLPAGEHGGTRCDRAGWDVTTSMKVVGKNGELQVQAEVRNDTDVPMQVSMSVEGSTVAPVWLGAGETTTVIVGTGLDKLVAGEAQLRLSRRVVGDHAVPSVTTTAEVKALAYAEAVLSPALGGAVRLPDDCTQNGDWQTVLVPVDNSDSTVAVQFTVVDDGARGSVLVGPGQTGVIEAQVPVGTSSFEILGSGSLLGGVDVPDSDVC